MTFSDNMRYICRLQSWDKNSAYTDFVPEIRLILWLVNFWCEEAHRIWNTCKFLTCKTPLKREMIYQQPFWNVCDAANEQTRFLSRLQCKVHTLQEKNQYMILRWYEQTYSLSKFKIYYQNMYYKDVYVVVGDLL